MTEVSQAITSQALPSTTPTDRAILEAAFKILARDGFGKLTARSVAEEAGTNLALLNYYFGGKKGLLLAIYDELERQRFARQTALYADESEPFSAKWRQAVDFYRSDLVDGFVRVHHELLAQGFADDELAERARQRINNWTALLAEAAERYLPELGIDAPASRLAPAISAFWYGMEQQHLIGVSEQEAPFFALLDMIGDWLETLEARADGNRVTAGGG